MKLINLFQIILLIIGLSSFSSCEETENDLFGSVYGIVTDADFTGSEPIQGVTVTLNPGGKTTVTGSDGRFDYSKIEAGQYTLIFQGSGYQSNTKTITVEPYITTRADIALSQGSSNLKVNKSIVEFGTSSDNNFFIIENTGKNSMRWEIIYECDWVKSISPLSGDLQAGKVATVIVIIDRSKIDGNNTQRTTLTIKTNDGGGANLQLVVNGSTGGGSSTVDNGLVAYFDFDEDNEGSQYIVSNLSDSENNGRLINSPSFIFDTPSGEGRAISLKSSKNQYFIIPENPLANSPDISKIESYSICLWVKDFGQGQLFAPKNIQYSYNSHPYFYVESNYFRLSVNRAAGYTYDVNFGEGANLYQDGNWHFVVYTFDQGYNSLYIDGKSFGGSKNNNYSTQTIFIDPFHFGGNCDISGRTAMDMKLDNIRFYKRCISLSEIKTIYSIEKN